MAQVAAQAPAYGGSLRQSSFDHPRSTSQEEEEAVSVRYVLRCRRFALCMRAPGTMHGPASSTMRHAEAACIAQRMRAATAP